MTNLFEKLLLTGDNGAYAFSDYLQVFGIGFGVVISVMILLIVILTLVGRVMRSASGKKKPAAAEAPVPPPVQAAPQAEEDEDEIAAIAAALCMMSDTPMQIKKIRRIADTAKPAGRVNRDSGWRKTALHEQLR